MNDINKIYKFISHVGNVYKFKIIPKNRGSGAGGANTNLNGLAFENKTSLKKYIINIRKENGFPVVKFPECDKEFIYLSKCQLQKYMKYKGEMTDAPKMHGAKEPDQCYVNESNKNLFILEDKFQQTTGSVVEKIQTVNAKIDNYKEQYPTYNIKYIYCLSNWFKNNIQAELKFLEKHNIPIFWGDDKNFHKNLIEYISKS